MKKAVKIPLIIAGILIVIGLAVVIIGFALNGTGWLFGTGKFEDKTVSYDGTFDSISLECDSCDITFSYAQDGKGRVEGHVLDSMELTAEVEGNTLVIKCRDKRNWFQFIGIRSDNARLTVFLPGRNFSSLEMTTASGDVNIPSGFSFDSGTLTSASGDMDIQAGFGSKLKVTLSSGNLRICNLRGSADVSLKAASGNITLQQLNCGAIDVDLASGDLSASQVNAASLKVKTASGEVKLEDLVCSGAMSLNTASGDVRFTRCDGASVKIATTSGEVKGSLLSDKKFNAHSTSGDVHVPQDGDGGPCTVKTTSGDISIRIDD